MWPELLDNLRPRRADRGRGEAGGALPRAGEVLEREIDDVPDALATYEEVLGLDSHYEPAIDALLRIAKLEDYRERAGRSSSRASKSRAVKTTSVSPARPRRESPSRLLGRRAVGDEGGRLGQLQLAGHRHGTAPRLGHAPGSWPSRACTKLLGVRVALLGSFFGTRPAGGWLRSAAAAFDVR